MSKFKQIFLIYFISNPIFFILKNILAEFSLEVVNKIIKLKDKISKIYDRNAFINSD